MSEQESFTERVCNLLFQISGGSLDLAEDEIEKIPDMDERAVYTGLLMLHEELGYQAEQRTAAEQAQRRHQERQQALFALAKVAIWDCDITGSLNQLRELGEDAARLIDEDPRLVRGLLEKLKINSVNQESLKLLGADTFGDLLARRAELFSDVSLPLFRQFWKHIAAGDRTVELQGVLRSLNGSDLHVVMGVTLPNEGDGFTIITIADVSAHHHRQAAERTAIEKTQELARINEEVERLFYAVSHDLRAPLRGVSNLAEWAVEDLRNGDSDSVAEHMAALQGRVDRLERMMNDLLMYARAGRIDQTSVERVNVADLVADLPSLIDLPPGFRIQAKGPLPSLSTVRTLLTQVFLNLVGNSIKHHDRGEGTIEISATEYDGTIEFAVADDGPGIPVQYRERVFGLFSTLKPRDKVEGSGMGLAFVQKVVRGVGGRVSIEGQGERGTKVVFTWPRERRAP